MHSFHSWVMHGFECRVLIGVNTLQTMSTQANVVLTNKTLSRVSVSYSGWWGTRVDNAQLTLTLEESTTHFQWTMCNVWETNSLSLRVLITPMTTVMEGKEQEWYVTVFSKNFITWSIDHFHKTWKSKLLVVCNTWFFKDSGRGTNTDWEFCSSSQPCLHKQGHCNNDDECVKDHICGEDNCRDFWNNAEPSADCCIPGFSFLFLYDWNLYLYCILNLKM